MRKRVLLGHLNSNGDCLLATVIARQIKEVDYPDCHLTWAVSSRCAQSIALNPYIDDIWEMPMKETLPTVDEWNKFAATVEDRRAKNEFDLVFLTQIFGENWFNYDGGIRSSTYSNYPHDITVPFQPIIELSDAEVQRVKDFAETHQLAKYKQVILVECGAHSFETALNTMSAYALASDITDGKKDIAFLLSSSKKIESDKPNIIDASILTFRENAELSKYCDLFVGCASGISWLMTTNWAKKLNMVLVINGSHVPFPSMAYDHEYLGLSIDHLIEIRSNEDAMAKLNHCLNEILDNGFADARQAFNETIDLDNYSFLSAQIRASLTEFEFARAFQCFKRAVRRNGLRLIFSSHLLRLTADLAAALVSKCLEKLGLKKPVIQREEIESERPNQR